MQFLLKYKVYILWGLGLLILAIVTKLVFSKSDEDKKEEKREKELEDDKTKLENEGLSLSYSQQWYKNAADTAYNAMDGIGANFDNIFQIMYKLKNDLDFVEFVGAFGIREGMTFGAWIRDQYNVAQIARFNQELKKNGISESL